MKFTKEDYKNLISEQESYMNLTNEMKLTLAEQQAIIYEDYDTVKKINEKRLQLQEQKMPKPKQKKNSQQPAKNTKMNKNKTNNPKQKKSKSNPQKDITLMGLTALISKLRAKRRDRIQKNQSTADIDKQLKAAIEKKKKLQATK